jgi:hypothetical protein
MVSWKGVELLVIPLEVDLPVYATGWADDVNDAFPKRHDVLLTHRWLREDAPLGPDPLPHPPGSAHPRGDLSTAPP